MGTQHVRMPVSYDNDPRIIRLNCVGRELHQYLIRHVKDQGWGGKCSDDAWDPDYLAARIGATAPGMREHVEPQMKKLVTLLLVRIEGGKIILPKWSKYQNDPTNAERQARWRERQKKKDVTQSNDLTTMGWDGIGGDRVERPPSRVEVGEEEDPTPKLRTQRLVSILRLKPDWAEVSEYEAEQHVQKLLSTYPDIDHALAINKGYDAFPPGGPLYRIWTFLQREGQYLARQQERDKPQGRPATPPEFQPQTREQYLAGLPPDERAKVEEQDRIAAEKYGGQGAEKLAEILSRCADATKLDRGGP